MSGTLIRGGTVIDGTGAPGYAADVRIANGMIVEIGQGLVSRGETEIDAKGAFVTPGFIDSHTHLDGAMFWAPDLHPIPGFGTTTAVFGNCGITMAPLPSNLQREVLELFCYLEDLPVEAFEKHVPWGWDASFGAYTRKAGASPTAINLEGYVGHINLRACVMGEAAWERAATPEECGKMAALLDDAMRNGSLGLSTNLMDNDQHHRPVPSRLADDAEFEALFDVLGRYPRAIAQIEARFAEPQHIAVDMERMANIARPRMAEPADDRARARIPPGRHGTAQAHPRERSGFLADLHSQTVFDIPEFRTFADVRMDAGLARHDVCPEGRARGDPGRPGMAGQGA
jgi:N-acyl-D-aspartate/D-glutamate deacylase